jgi:hypothetical protein
MIFGHTKAARDQQGIEIARRGLRNVHTLPNPRNSAGFFQNIASLPLCNLTGCVINYMVLICIRGYTLKYRSMLV